MRVRVVGRAFELTHDDPACAQAGASALAQFTPTTGTSDWQLRFRRGPQVAPREMSYVCTRESEQRFSFVSAGAFSGWIDVGKHEADVVLEAEAAYGIAQRNVLRFALILDLQLTGGLVLHAASRIFEREAYVFAGRSEIGKSTLSRAFPPRDFLGDELCFIDEQQVVHRTPFFGEVPAPEGELTAPLAMLVMLAQAPAVALTRLSPAAAARALLTTTVHLCHDPALTRVLVDRVAALCERLPVIHAGVPRFAAGELEPVMAALSTLAGFARPA